MLGESGIPEDVPERYAQVSLTQGRRGVQNHEPVEHRITFDVLGVRVDAVQIPSAVAKLEEWIRARKACRYVAVTGMHGVMEAQYDNTFKRILNSADLVVPDGMPLVWLGRLRGFPLKRRVYGPELMLAFCKHTVGREYRHFFYGAEPGVPEQLAATLSNWFPGLRIAGAYSPPFRPLTSVEQEKIAARINKVAPDIVWVGLSTPKQEKWMYEYKDRLAVPVMIGVGAAFDLNSGKIKQAPQWIREHGLEWFFRLWQEPRRLWRRYLVYGSQFVWYVVLELLGLKRFR